MIAGVRKRPVLGLFIVAVIYFALCYSLSLGSGRLERQWAKAR